MKTTTTLEFIITRRNVLIADGDVIKRFLTEAAAADMAIRFAQDIDAPYSIIYEARR